MRRISSATSEIDLPSLPPEAITRDGIPFNPHSNLWKLSDLTGTRVMKFDDFEFLAPEIVLRLKWFIALKIKEVSYSYTFALFNSFRIFYFSVLYSAESPVSCIEISHILSFKSRLDDSTEWKMGVLRSLLTGMKRLGLGIASEEVMDYLECSKIRGTIKGTSIRTRDPEKGAFSDTDLLAIQSALNDAYAIGRISLYSFAIVWIFLSYGCRPVQIAALKEKDLIVKKNKQANAYALRIPRAKQRGRSHRDVFKTRYCSKQIGMLLEHVIEHNASKRSDVGLKQGDAPLFIGKKAGSLTKLAYHCDSNNIQRIVSNTIKQLTGLKGNSRRFRITLAQRAVDDGKDKYTVAELLDHSDTQNVEVYFEASPAMVLCLDRHLAMELAPLAQAFAGVVVQTEQDARRGEDRSSRIFDRTLADNIADPLGTCGQMSFCGLAAPFACYTCRHFHPWIDGPHEAFMAAMIEDRNQKIASGLSPKIYTIRDRAILAAAEVIQLCLSAKESAEAIA